MNIDIIRDALSKFCGGRDCRDCPFNNDTLWKDGRVEHRGCRLSRDEHRIDWDEELDLLMRELFGWNMIGDSPVIGMRDDQLRGALDKWCLQRDCRKCPLYGEGGHGYSFGYCDRDAYYEPDQRVVADKLVRYLFGDNPVFRDRKIPESFQAHINARFRKKE